MKTAILSLIILFLVPGPSAGGPLSRDPFKPPADVVDSAGDTNRPSAMSIGANPEIKSILFAGADSLVNLNGRIIAVGQEVEGYELLEVAERYAIFRHGEEIMQLSLNSGESDE